MIFIDSIQSAYYPDLLAGLQNDTNIEPPQSGASPGTAITDPAIPTGSRGFLITLSLTTPHKDGFIYVLNTLAPNLLKWD